MLHALINHPTIKIMLVTVALVMNTLVMVELGPENKSSFHGPTLHQSRLQFATTYVDFHSHTARNESNRGNRSKRNKLNGGVRLALTLPDFSIIGPVVRHFTSRESNLDPMIQITFVKFVKSENAF